MPPVKSFPGHAIQGKGDSRQPSLAQLLCAVVRSPVHYVPHAQEKPSLTVLMMVTILAGIL